MQMETGISGELAGRLVRLASMTRELKDSGLMEGASTRLVVQAARLIAGGIDEKTACRVGMILSLTDDPELLTALEEMVVVGVNTNLDFQYAIMENETFRAGLADTGFIEQFLAGEV